MSSAPAEPKAGKKRRPFEPWRKVMLLGALILLGHALLVAMIDTPPPGWASTALNFVGYGFLVAGFGIRMREQKGHRGEGSKKPNGDAGL